MKRAFFAALALFFAVATTGCQSQGVPQFKKAAVTPADLQPGQTAVIEIDVQDYHGIVQSIEGTVRDYPQRTFKVKDDGVAPDKTAGDGVWTMEVSVPFQAPPGEHFIEFTAYDREGRAIVVPDEQGHAAPLSTQLRVVISYPPEQ
jgi:hypothetical protein